MEVKFMKRNGVNGVRLVRHSSTNDLLCVCGRIRNMEEANLIKHLSGPYEPEHFIVIYPDGTFNIEPEWEKLRDNLKLYFNSVSFEEWKEQHPAFHLQGNLKEKR